MTLSGREPIITINCSAAELDTAFCLRYGRVFGSQVAFAAIKQDVDAHEKSRSMLTHRSGWLKSLYIAASALAVHIRRPVYGWCGLTNIPSWYTAGLRGGRVSSPKNIMNYVDDILVSHLSQFTRSLNLPYKRGQLNQTPSHCSSQPSDPYSHSFVVHTSYFSPLQFSSSS